jgi:hypothetical protein
MKEDYVWIQVNKKLRARERFCFLLCGKYELGKVKERGRRSGLRLKIEMQVTGLFLN